MDKIIRKSFRDFKNHFKPIFGPVFMLTTIVSVVVSIIFKNIGWSIILIFICIIGTILISYFIWFIARRLIIMGSKNDILVIPLQNTRDEILLQIINENDEDFVNVEVELICAFIGETEFSYLRINSNQNYFSEGLREKNNAIYGNSHSKINIAKNDEGKLRLLLDEEYLFDIFPIIPEEHRNEVFRLIIKLSGKLVDIGYISHLYECKFKYLMTDVIETTSEKNSYPVYKILWLDSGKEIKPLENEEEVLKKCGRKE